MLNEAAGRRQQRSRSLTTHDRADQFDEVAAQAK